MRRWLTGLYLVGYVASYFATGLFVRCVHRDGREFLEPITDLCCDEKVASNDSDLSPASLLHQVAGSVISGDSCPDCDDYAIVHLAVFQSTQAEDAGPSFEEASLHLPYLLFHTSSLDDFGARASLAAFHPLPRGSPPICRVIVLRI